MAQWRLHVITGALLLASFVPIGEELKSQRKMLTSAQTLGYSWGFGLHLVATLLHLSAGFGMAVLLARQTQPEPANRRPLIDAEAGLGEAIGS